MTVHVDLVETHWSAGFQERVARVVAGAEQLQIEADPHWDRLIREALAAAGDPVGAQEALRAISQRFQSDYAHATEPHHEAECPFANGSRIPFEQGRVGDREVTPAGG
jgi:hypothetical protein